ncbi:hypothetical protein D917_00952 [Trichinella nativa]|uniref:Protein-serine/threonine kinase n=1 Tax=Trichinella nativa TaxID=6335 RepID=A0A1Y3EWY7_9BILA|nr:hypothetical protein D917_00952 [Trichinella nativa]
MQFTRYLFSPLIRIIGRKIDDYAQFRPSALSMQSLVDFGKLRDERNSFEFLKKELLVRLANIMKEVELLPSQLMETPSTKLVYQWYQESFQELLQYENANADESTLRDFSRQLSRVLKRHNTVVETMAEVSDQGGGVPRHIVGKLFNYMYTTASLPSVENVEYDAPMAGLGYGLPLSRLYARYFLGDLFLFSMEGYGTDACLYLKASAVDASEMLPWFSFRSKKMYESNEKGPDWSG